VPFNGAIFGGGELRVSPRLIEGKRCALAAHDFCADGGGRRALTAAGASGSRWWRWLLSEIA
jgi:hypothetical protein